MVKLRLLYPIPLCLLFLLFLNNCYQQTGNGVLIHLNSSTLQVQVCDSHIIHITHTPGRRLKTKPSLIVEREWQPVSWTVQDVKDSLVLTTDHLILKINKHDGAVQFYDRRKFRILTASACNESSFVPASIQDEKVFHIEQRFLLSENEGLYGLGQFQDGMMNYRGKDIYLVQANRIAVVPFLLSTNHYGLLWDNYSASEFHDSRDGMTLRSEVADQIDYYFIHGDKPDDVIAGYRSATGHAPLYPKWAYGYWQSREHYRTQMELLSVADEFRKRKIPIDNLIQDWSYWGYHSDYFSGMTWDPQRYPNPLAMIQSLHLDHFHFMVSIWPALGQKTSIYRELHRKGFIFAKTHWSGGKLYDAYSAAARSIYWKHIDKGLFSIGVDGFWMDGTEPELTSTADPFITGSEIIACGKNTLGTFSRYLNPYSLMATRGVYENQRLSTAKKRVYILTRSAFAGQQRFAATTWSGDIGASWDVLRKQICAGLNFCMAGIPYWTCDIGGFLLNQQGGMYPDGADPAYHELYVRWFQFGAFCPIFRSHGTNTPREPWQFGEPGSRAFDTIVKFDHLRYRLMPYLYSQAWRVTAHDYTLMRGLVMDFPEDKNVYGIDNQFMFGPAILVCPVTSAMYHKTKKQEDLIPSANLFTPENEPGRLWTEFYQEENLTEKIFEIPMVEIALTWSGSIPEQIKNSPYSVRWSGQVLTQEQGSYEFVLHSDGGERLWIEDRSILDDWKNDLFKRKSAGVRLKANRLYDIRLEHRQGHAGGANMKLEWISPQAGQPALTQVVDCYLPQAPGWYDFWSGEFYSGAATIQRGAPLDIMPLFIRAGSILPLGPFLQYSDEKPADPIELRIYTGADAEFILYEDENDGYQYEKGVCATIPIQWNDTARTLTIGKREGEFPGMLKERIFHIVWVTVNHGIGVDMTKSIDRVARYDGEEIQIIM